MAVLTKLISLTNFVIASSALAFQVGVLYPWHHELDAEFQELKKEYRELMTEQRLEREKRMEELGEIRKEIEKLSAASGKKGFWA
ncbi:hypothetical protein BJ508DRAFT_13557 [Ascobolus immersus RN42]|uniref:Uncharacterized protein n=1 Tax=Ascobolus immersus RN42 TaxID=1160509 RepID=A0A3N4IU72_ASCIM|nr:hypothetical protein BJ508DRAFT_13557 [Ascobolus immersus RN42]